jgi:hypothetical protein
MLIKGYWQTRRVTIDHKTLTPDRSQQAYNHSPDGFSWGYYGSGPAQLALAILLEATDKQTALHLYQDFKEEIIAPLEKDKDFVISLNVGFWIKEKIGQENLEICPSCGRLGKKDIIQDLGECLGCDHLRSDVS